MKSLNRIHAHKGFLLLRLASYKQWKRFKTGQQSVKFLCSCTGFLLLPDPMGTPNKIKADELALVAAIKNDSFEKNKYIKHLINDYQGFIHKIKSETGLDESILKDIYTDTVLLILQHIRNDTFRGRAGYLLIFIKYFTLKRLIISVKMLQTGLSTRTNCPNKAMKPRISPSLWKPGMKWL